MFLVGDLIISLFYEVVTLNKVQVGVMTVFYDPCNMTKEQAVEQAEKAQERCRRQGSMFYKFTANIPHKGEPWYERLCNLKRSMSEKRK